MDKIEYWFIAWGTPKEEQVSFVISKLSISVSEWWEELQISRLDGKCKIRSWNRVNRGVKKARPDRTRPIRSGQNLDRMHIKTGSGFEILKPGHFRARVRVQHKKPRTRTGPDFLINLKK